jgi:predicted lipoprotein
MKFEIVNLLFISSLLVFFACKPKKDSPNETKDTPNREAVLINLADQIIIPGYTQFNTSLIGLASSYNKFADEPTIEYLNAFRTDWEKAYLQWQTVELFDVGPASDYALRFYFNIYPTNTSLVQTNISDGNANLGRPANYAAQGFPALDYMLYGIASTDTEILNLYTTDASAQARLKYIGLIIAQMNLEFKRVFDLWNTSYRDTFVSRTGVDITSSFGQLVNGYVLNYERFIRSGKIGIPSGAMMNGVVAPEKVEAYYRKDLSKKLVLAANTASKDFFMGTSRITHQEGQSFYTYLKALTATDSKTGADLANQIKNKFDDVTNAILQLGDNFAEQTQTNNAGLIAAYNQMQTQVRLLKVDLTSAMSITITYTDNDGD